MRGDRPVVVLGVVDTRGKRASHVHLPGAQHERAEEAGEGDREVGEDETPSEEHRRAFRRRAPGQGAMKFAPIFAALKRNGYDETVAVEPFDYIPDGPGAAAFAACYLRGVRECLA